MQEQHSSESTIVYDETESPSSLSATLVGNEVNLAWSGTSDEYIVYRSTTPISSVVGLTMFDETPIWGDPVPSPLEPIGTTTYFEWSESVPVATTLYYAVTSVVDDREIVWIIDGQNHVSLDASSIASSSPDSVEEANPMISFLISGIMAIIGITALALALFGRRR
ncbi:MAG: hypothetical protein L7R66_02300 [Candidatus Thalassarchaeaceae archaeon]|nr:hypothetical protein [Candidatus Thalassarchaeaceae archaeon]